jgi:hypothetical protein
MTDLQQSETEHRGGWLWLAFFVAVGSLVVPRNDGISQLLFGAGFLLLGVFAYYHNPLTLAQRPAHSMTLAHRLSAYCGIAGIVMVVAAAVAKWA